LPASGISKKSTDPRDCTTLPKTKSPQKRRSERKFDVIGLGYTCTDYLAVVPHLPELDSKLEIKEFLKQGGGPVATAMVALSRLGARVKFIGKVGDDDFGEYVLSELGREGVDTEEVVVERGKTSQFAFIMVDEHTGKRTILWTRGSVSNLSPHDVMRESVRSGEILLVDDLEVEAALSAAALARETGVQVVVDASSNRKGMKKLARLADHLIATESFVHSLTGVGSVVDGLVMLAKSGPRVACATRGDLGSIAVSGEDIFECPAFSVPVKDTTGAGDVFHAGYVFGLIKKWDLKKRVRFASGLAAMKCTMLGGRTALPSESEMTKFMKSVLGDWEG
jgi:sulfofructose kinase